MFNAKAGPISPSPGQPGSTYVSGTPPTANFDSADTAGIGVTFSIGSFVQVGTGAAAALYRAISVVPGAADWNLVMQG